MHGVPIFVGCLAHIWVQEALRSGRIAGLHRLPTFSETFPLICLCLLHKWYSNDFQVIFKYFVKHKQHWPAFLSGPKLHNQKDLTRSAVKNTLPLCKLLLYAVTVPVFLFATTAVFRPAPGAHLSSYPMDAGCSFPRGKAGETWSWPFTRI